MQKVRSKSKEFRDARSAERQHGVAHLVASGPRVVLEALIEVSHGKSLDDVLRALGANVLPVHAEFERALRAVQGGRRQ